MRNSLTFGLGNYLTVDRTLPRPSPRSAGLDPATRFRLMPDEGFYEMDERPAMVLAALARLSPRQRAAFVLHYYADYPAKEIASIVGSSPATVAVHLHRARARGASNFLWRRLGFSVGDVAVTVPYGKAPRSNSPSWQGRSPR